MSTVAAAGAGEAVGKDAAFEVLAKDLLHIGRRSMVAATTPHAAHPSPHPPRPPRLINRQAFEHRPRQYQGMSR